MSRVEKAREIIAEYEIDAILLYGGTDIRYISGFTGDDSQVLITEDGAFLFTDGRFTEQAGIECPDYTLIETGYSTRLDAISKRVDESGAKVLGIDFDRITGSELNALEDAINESVEFADVSPFIAMKRMVKDGDEIEALQAAADFTDRAFEHILKYIKPGVSENDIKAELSYFAIKNGTDFSFPPIIVSGERGSLPHGVASAKLIAAGEFLTMDMGFLHNGYCSDFTRTVAVGEPTDSMRKVYDIVKGSQAAAIEAACAGATSREIDAAARDFITDNGFGDCFVHGTGHGVGLDIHEEPRVSKLCDDVMTAGMVITIEPGIYVPQKFGVRIEDMVLIKNDGCHIFNVASRELIVV